MGSRQLAIAALVLGACGGKKDEAKPKEQEPVPVAVAPDAAPKPAPAPDAAPVAAAPLVELPALDLAAADPKSIAASAKLNNEGYAAHKAKDWATAEAKYTAAVKADPGNLRARYNLACVYSSSDQADKAFFVLAQFEQPDCRACDEVLLKSKTDHEWTARVQDPKYLAILDGVDPAPTDLEQVSMLVQKALESHKTAGLEPYFHPRNPFKVAWMSYDPDAPEKWVPHTGVAGLLDIEGTGGEGYVVSDVARCEKNCCSMEEHGEGEDGVSEICFEGTAPVLFVSKILLQAGSV